MQHTNEHEARACHEDELEMSGLDASFLHVSATAHMHTLKVLVLELPPSRRNVRRALLDHLAQQVDRLPALALRPRARAFDRPVWQRVEPDLSAHVRYETVWGGAGAIEEAVGAFASRPLRRDRPLWELLALRGRPAQLSDEPRRRRGSLRPRQRALEHSGADSRGGGGPVDATEARVHLRVAREGAPRSERTAAPDAVERADARARAEDALGARAAIEARADVSDSEQVRLTLGEWRSPMLAANGKPQTVRGPDGSATRFSVRHHAGRLYARADTDRGTRESWLTLTRDGSRLRLQVRISSERLPEAIEYELAFRRASRVY